MTAERRNQRISGVTQIVQSAEDQSEIGITTSFSPNGLFMSTGKQWPMGTVLPLLVDHRVCRLTVKGEVVDQREDGVGLAFVDLSGEDRKLIEMIMASLLADGAWYDERRRTVRAPVFSPVIWSQNGREAPSWITNVSTEGCLIEAEDAPPVESRVFLHLPQADDPEPENLSSALGGSQAQVVHRRAGCFGVEFVSPTTEFIQSMHKMISKAD